MIMEMGMSTSAPDDGAGTRRSAKGRPSRIGSGAPTAEVAGYALSLMLVVFAAAIAMAAERVVGAPNVTLIFVLPVVVAASAFGWGPALATVVAGALAFDFLFTEPRYSLQIYNPSDMWAAALLLVIAALVSAVAAEGRRRALEAREAAEQAMAVQTLAHAVIERRSRADVLQTAAQALNQAFRAPAVIFLQDGAVFSLAASAGAPQITAAEEEAARWVLTSGTHARAETYPFDRSLFDFWPVAAPGSRSCVLGVGFAAARRGRPASPEQMIDIVAGYVAVALGQSASSAMKR